MSDFKTDVEKAASDHARLWNGGAENDLNIERLERDVKLYQAGAEFGRERGFQLAVEMLNSEEARHIHMNATKRDASWPSDWAHWLKQRLKEMRK